MFLAHPVCLALKTTSEQQTSTNIQGVFLEPLSSDFSCVCCVKDLKLKLSGNVQNTLQFCVASFKFQNMLITA